MKFSNDQSSARLLCRGVPVNSRRCSLGYDLISFISLCEIQYGATGSWIKSHRQSIFFKRWPSSTTINCHDRLGTSWARYCVSRMIMSYVVHTIGKSMGSKPPKGSSSSSESIFFFFPPTDFLPRPRRVLRGRADLPSKTGGLSTVRRSSARSS